MISGVLFTTNVKNILELPHEKRYNAAIRKPTSRIEAWFGYRVIKLTKDVTWYAGWRPDGMEEFTAKKGDYLVQCLGNPPKIIKTWVELRRDYKVFQKTEDEN